MLDFIITAGNSNQTGLVESLKNLWDSTGLAGMANFDWAYASQLIMLCVAGLLLFLAISKQFEPNLLLAMAFGMFIVNIPGAYEILYPVQQIEHAFEAEFGHLLADGTWTQWGYDQKLAETIANAGATPGLLDILYMGVDYVLFPPLIFLGIGAMTDFGPLIANPKSLLLGAAAQIGIFVTFVLAIFMGFTGAEAASIGIIGGADGPTAIYLTSKLAPNLLSSIAIAAYSYMALVPVIQPPIMKMLTTKKERSIVMEQLRPVSKREKILFPIVVTGIIGIILPSALPLLAMLMLGNLMKESEVVPRLTSTAKNELINIITILLGITVGSKAHGEEFLNEQTMLIIVLGVLAFGIATAAGVLIGKLMCKLSKGKINPLIGAAGVSAVPMAARVAQDVGIKDNPNNYLLMHAMGPNVAGVIGSAVAAGVLLAIYGG